MDQATIQLEGEKVLVLGLGISGRSAARFCAERGARVVAADERNAGELSGIDELAAGGVELRTGAALPDAGDFDLVVPSPGVPRERYRESAARRGVPVWGDVELAYRSLPVPLAAVTGTNGKSTTVCLLEALLREAGFRVRAAGNLGEPALGLVGEALDVAVLEVSSFQLETTEAFRPRVAVVLNVSPDHIDRHGDFASYLAAKARILENQQASDTAVLNLDDPAVRELASAAKARVWAFSRAPSATSDAAVWLDGEAVVLRDGAREQRISLEGFPLPGRHNRDNAAMALAAAMALGADLAAAAPALAHFEGLAHRSECVGVLAGVRFVNDSKATNPGAAARSLEGFDARVVWIAGGRDKQLDFSALADAAAARARCALLIGEAAPSLEKALGERVECERCDSLDEAVDRAAELAAAGDVVLLAPACASFDQFESYAARGEAFRAAFESLRERRSQP